jgi:hypothetical protein
MGYLHVQEVGLVITCMRVRLQVRGGAKHRTSRDNHTSDFFARRANFRTAPGAQGAAY